MALFENQNTYWKFRKKHGRERIFETPEELLNQCIAYFKWCDENPLKKSEIVKYKDYAELMEVPLVRAYTKEGLADFCEVSQYKTISNYKEYSTDFLQVITYVENVIYNQKFTNAAAGLLNSNIIARDLGLSEKSAIEHSGEMKTNHEPVKIIFSDIEAENLQDDDE